MDDLARLIRQLVDEEGLTHEEAMKVAAASIRAARGSFSLTRRGSSGPLTPNIQDDPRRMHYGAESPAEAKRRWIEQERADPQGIYSFGGSTAGGIFSGGAIPMDDHDPEGAVRTLHAHAQLQQLQVQKESLRLLQEMREELGASRENTKELSDGKGERRLLGRKKRER